MKAHYAERRRTGTQRIGPTRHLPHILRHFLHQRNHRRQRPTGHASFHLHGCYAVFDLRVGADECFQGFVGEEDDGVGRDGVQPARRNDDGAGLAGQIVEAESDDGEIDEMRASNSGARSWTVMMLLSEPNNMLHGVWTVWATATLIEMLQANNSTCNNSTSHAASTPKRHRMHTAYHDTNVRKKTCLLVNDFVDPRPLSRYVDMMHPIACTSP